MSMHQFDFDAIMIAVQAGVPASLTGDPGAGKTKWVESLVTKSLGWHMETIVASTREPTDFAGYPCNHDGKIKLLPVGSFLDALKSHERSVVFLDEFSNTPPAVQAAALKFINEGMLGEERFDIQKVSFLLANNPPEIAANGWEFTPPMANRIAHFDWNPNPDLWINGMLEDFPPIVATKLPNDWRKEIPAARALVAAFIKSRPALLQALPKDVSHRSGPWPSRRTWDFCATLYAAAESVNATKDVKLALATSVVGHGAGFEFITWVTELDIPDPEESLRHPKAVKLPARGDQIFVFLVSVAAAVVRNNTSERWNAAWEVFAHAIDAGHPDFAVPACKMLTKQENMPKSLGGKLPDALNKFMPILQAIGKIAS